MSEQLSSLASLLSQVLAEQKQQTTILNRMAEQQLLLIQALAEDQGEQDPDAMPLTYMDGSLVNE
jgi:hypothetical protein